MRSWAGDQYAGLNSLAGLVLPARQERFLPAAVADYLCHSRAARRAGWRIVCHHAHCPDSRSPHVFPRRAPCCSLALLPGPSPQPLFLAWLCYKVIKLFIKLLIKKRFKLLWVANFKNRITRIQGYRFCVGLRISLCIT